MRRDHKPRVIWSIVWIIVVLFIAWWIGGEYYKPYPPPTQAVTPTRTSQPTWTATNIPTDQPTATPTASPTNQPTDQPTATQTPTPTDQPTIQPVETATPTATTLPILYDSVEDKEYECMTFYIRPWGIKVIYRCWLPQPTATPDGKFDGSPIFVP